ncbi:lectin-like [Coregonus clupeaformis]|uniref:lectin-like n=1 Tax=Coregonus clupeaformis TaxID=59861 RepID=UPI001BE076AA|nr:lectin-like [Coregonus clupeaformis]
MSTNYMSTGRILLKDDKLVSNNGEFTAIFQGDGNFVVYDKCGPIWASHSNHAKAQELILQEDGNLVLYTSQGTERWSGRLNRPKSGLVLPGADAE